MNRSIRAWKSLTLAAVGALTLTACGSDGGSGSANNAAAETEQETESTDGGDSAGDIESIELVVSHSGLSNGAIHHGAVRFTELVEEYSDGQITGEVFPESQLGGENEQVEGLQLGSVNVALVGGALFASFCEPLGVFGLPYVITGDTPEAQYENLQRVAESDLNQQLIDDCAQDQGYRVIDNSWWFGNRQTTSNVPIEAPSDFEGLRLRTPPADLHTLALQAFGAETVPLDFPELYTALETGTVDGQENPINTIFQASFYEVQDHISLTAHMTQNQTAVMNDETFNSYSPQAQDVIMRAIRDAGQEAATMQIQANADDLGKLEDEGMQVTRPNLEPFRQAVQEDVEAFFAKHGISLDEFLNAQE